MRQDWDSYFISLAKTIATRSTCLRAQHGAILVQDKTIISTGYNGAPRGIPSCDEKGQCFRQDHNIEPGTRYELCLSAHAEQNAIALAARTGARVDGATLYITALPCLMCARLIINAGIESVIIDKTSERYTDQGTINLLMLANIEVHRA